MNLPSSHVAQVTYRTMPARFMPLPQITSRSNPKVRQAASLRNRKQRDSLGQTIVYGVRETARALAAGGEAVRAMACPKLFRGDDPHAVVSQLLEAGCEVLEVTEEVFERIAYGDRLDGLATIFQTRVRSLSELKVPSGSLVAVIEGIEKPGNLGAILRSADGAGVDAIVLVDPVIDLFNPNAIRSSVSTVFKPNIGVASPHQALEWLQGGGFSMWAARPDADQLYSTANFTSPTALLLGNEAEGLTPFWDSVGVQGISLPMLGLADSLNVSTAAAVLFYEACRQRGGR